MTDAINLLPWREQRRVRRRRTLLAALLAAGLAASLLCWGWARVAADHLAAQRVHNRHLQQELERLDEQAREIDGLRHRRQRLEARLGVVEALRSRRPVTVHLFDQLVRTVPDGLHYTRMECGDGDCTIRGVAESNARIASLMKNLERSPWLRRPQLLSVTAMDGPAAASEFVLKVGVMKGGQSRPASAGEVGRP